MNSTNLAPVERWGFFVGAVVCRPARFQRNYHHHSCPSLPVKATRQAKLAASVSQQLQHGNRDRTPATSPLDTALSQLANALPLGKWGALRWFLSMRSVPFEFVSGLAAEFGAVECCWRESERSFTGYVAECWFGFLPTFFAQRWAAVVGYSVLVRSVSSGPGRFMVSVPVTVPQGSIRLSGGQRGGRARVVVHSPSAY